MPDAIKQWKYRIAEFQLKQSLMPHQHRGLATALDMNDRPRLWRFARAYMGQNPALIKHALDQYFDLAATGLLPEQARRNDSGVVEHHQVAGTHVVKQVREMMMGQLPALAIKHEQTTGAALGQWVSSDLRIGKLEGKIGDLHGKKIGAQAQGAQSLAETLQSDHERRLTTLNLIPILRRHCASMAESVDAADSKSAVGNNVRVRVSLEAP